MKILAVIPARGGSKGIPKKNIRLMNGQPLISYVIKTALSSNIVTDVAVSTDSPEIADIARRYGSDVVMRVAELSTDLVTLDPVVYDAVKRLETKYKCVYDVVITIQPTSPLLSVVTLDSAIKYFLDGQLDTVISAINRPHLSWRCVDDKIVPAYEARKNRQELPAQFLETGAFLIAKRNAVTENSRIGSKVSVYEVPEREAIDIDDKNDWLLTENILKRKKIIFRADGYKALGLGHIYNSITLAYSFIGHDVLMVLSDKSVLGLEKIKESNLPYKVVHSDADIEGIINEYQPDIWINDCLNTEKEYIDYLKQRIPKVVTIEDIGSGADIADAVINALYEHKNQNRHVYSGWKYVCLRDEFQITPPNNFSGKVRKVLVMFGGTDPANLNKLVYDIIQNLPKQYGQIRFEFITGIGYDAKSNCVVDCPEKNIYIYPDVPHVTKYMQDADLCITSQGRTIFELAAMGVPAIVLSQNKRETTHKFANLEHGYINLGMGDNVDAEMLLNTLKWLIDTPVIRKNMYETMLKYPLRTGLERVKNIILGDNEDER